MNRPSYDRIQAGDGYPIATRHFSADSPRAVAIIAPAMGVKQDFYAPLAHWLAAHGVGAYTFDYRGMGASRPSAPGLRGFRADICDWARLDCPAIIDAAAAQYPDTPLFWIGHSVGAQIVGLIPNHDRLQGMLSVAAGSGYWRFNAVPLRYYVLSMWQLFMPLGVLFTGYFPGKRLRLVDDLPRGVALQWRKWCLSSQYLGVEGEALRSQLAQVRMPIRALSMHDDEMMTLRGTRALFALYGNAALEVRRVRASDHGLPAIGHFGFFRQGMQAALWPMVTDFIDQLLAGASAQQSAGLEAVHYREREALAESHLA